MKKVDIIFLLEGTERKLFTTEDLRKLLGVKKSNTLYKTIESIKKEKILIPLSKGKYLYRTAKPQDFEVANFIYTPSYVSFESALNYYNILVQTPYSIMSATPLRSKTKFSNEREYIYNHVAPKIYFGYKREGAFLIATPEKALADLMYLASKGLRHLDAGSLDLSQVDNKILRFMLNKMSNKLLNNYAKKFIK